jgi:hypothetical protein
MCEYFGIIHRLTTPYWPRANGEVERFNRNIGVVMRKAASAESVWQKELNMWLGAYRTKPHSSTGVPPAQLIFKFNYTQRLAQLCATRDFHRNDDDDIAVENDKAAKAYMKVVGDKRLRAVKCDLEVGDNVLFRIAQNETRRQFL